MVGHFSALLSLSVLHHCLQFEPEHIWSGKSRHCACAWEGHCPVHTRWGWGAASGICTRVIDTSQTLPMALIFCVDRVAVNSCKSNYSHQCCGWTCSMNDRSWPRSYFRQTWTERTYFCLMNIIVNELIVAFVNGVFSQFNLVQDSARFPSSLPGENTPWTGLNM